jgi:adenylate cyclase
MPRRPLVFGQFLLNPDQGTLLKQGERVAVGRRGILLLEALLKRQGEVLTKEELLDAAWPGTAVEESNLSVQIALLRKAIGVDPEGREWIATVPRIGYCFAASQPETGAPDHVASSRPSVAILPFNNLSADREQAFFADGLAEEIIAALSKVSGLLVIARSSSFAYRGASVDVRRIAKDLGVRYVVEGSVRKNGGRIRIFAQLSDGLTGSHLWADRYDRDLSDVFAVQDEIAQAIVTELSAVLNPAEAAQWPSIPCTGTTSLDAYQAFLRGRAMQRGATQNADVFRRTIELFREAIEHDPSYSAPYAALAMALAHDHYNRWSGDPESSLGEAAGLVDEAVKLNPRDPFAHGVAALVAMYGKDFARWQLEVDEALSLDPNFAPALSLRGALRMYSGNTRAAIGDLERAIRLDPLFTQGYLHHLGVAHLVAGDYETAAAIFRERILLVPDTDMSRACLASALGNLGYKDEARQVWSDLLAVKPTYTFATGVGRMPFKELTDLARIARGLERAGLLERQADGDPAEPPRSSAT